MNTNFNTRALALAGAVTGGVVILACFAVGALLGRPDPWMDLLAGSGPSVGGWLVGIGEGALVGFGTGGLVGLLYNWFARRTGAPSVSRS